MFIRLLFYAETVAETISLEALRLLSACLGENAPSLDILLSLEITESPSSTLEILRALVPMFALA